MNSCVLCGEKSNHVVYADDRLIVIQCLFCGLVRQENYAAALAKVNNAAVEVSEHYRENKTEIVVNPSKQKRTADIQHRIARDFRPKAAVLDIGCGQGEFMQALQEIGLPVIGIEPNVRRATYVKEHLGLRVIASFYQETLFEPDSFDVITFIQVLEHVDNPLEMLTIAYKHLRPRGYVVIDVPGYNNPRFLLYRLTKQKWFVQGDFIPSHNYYYTRKTLSQIVEAAGFCILDVMTGRYAVKYGHKHRLLKVGLGPIDKLANLLGIGGITLYAQKV